MSQYGMQMPGGQFQRGPTLTVYTGLLAVAVVALAFACAFVYYEGAKIAPEGQPFSVHAAGPTEGVYDIKLRDAPGSAQR